MAKTTSFFKRLNWRSYDPADERERMLYEKAHRIAYRALIGLLFSTPFYVKMVTLFEVNAEILIWIVLGYVSIGFLIVEWAGSTVFTNEDISFTKPSLIRWYDVDERMSVAATLIYVILASFATFVYFFVTTLF